MNMRILPCAILACCVLTSASGCRDKTGDKANTNSPTAGRDTPPSQPETTPDTRMTAFAYGTRVAAAAVLHADGAPEARVTSEIKQARLLASMMNIATPELPPRGDDKDKNREALGDFFRDTGGKQILRQLTDFQGPAQAAFFSLAVEMHLVRAHYDPASADNAARAQALTSLATAAGLPDGTATAAAAALGESKPKQEVLAAFLSLRTAVKKYLRALPPGEAPKTPSNLRVVPAGPAIRLDKKPAK